ncbi:MAG: endonuclease/exonuclease/phosphatase family protein [Bdellovibrionota bacterium]
MKTNQIFAHTMKSKITNAILVLVAAATAVSCGARHDIEDSSAPLLFQAQDSNTGSIMAFNVENLFDTLHDENTNDETYLPKAVKDASPELQAKCALQTNEFYKKECLELDWSETVVQAKLKNVAETILSVDGGRGPDVLLVEEVENERILVQLRDNHLQNAGYQTLVHIEGFDTRGIDVAVMSRYPLRGQPILHKIPFKGLNPEDQAGMDKSRGILEVPLTLPDGSPMTVMALHFPSQSNPRYWREQAVDFLKQLLANRSDVFTVVGGDFNISAKEEAETKWFSSALSMVGTVSHIAACQKCKGTHYYKGEFEFLDALIFPNGSVVRSELPWKVDLATIEVIRNNPRHVTPAGVPIRFDPVKMSGVSDHLPIYGKFRKVK